VRRKSVLDLFTSLQILYPDLTRLIAQYEAGQEWESNSFLTWDIGSGANGILNHQKHLYICSFGYSGQLVYVYNTNREKIYTNKALKYPWTVDINEKKSLVYIASLIHINILSLDLELISSWEYPVRDESKVSRGLKVDDDTIYLTIEGYQQIYLCNSQNGTLLSQWGTTDGGSKDIEFDDPRNITVDDKYVYICDCNNHRIQILTKEKNGVFVTPWGNGKGTEQGQFVYPYSIYLHSSESLFYIGDDSSVQLFYEDGFCIQRICGRVVGHNELNHVYGLCIMDDHLYVTQCGNSRIQIYQRVK